MLITETITRECCQPQDLITSDIVLTSIPPRYPARCKHCGAEWHRVNDELSGWIWEPVENTND